MNKRFSANCKIFSLIQARRRAESWRGRGGRNEASAGRDTRQDGRGQERVDHRGRSRQLVETQF